MHNRETCHSKTNNNERQTTSQHYLDRGPGQNSTMERTQHTHTRTLPPPTTTTTTPTTNSNPPTTLRRTLQPEPHSNKQTNYQTNGDNALEHLHLRSEATAHTHDLQELIPATAILTPATFNRNLTNARQRKQLTTRLASNTLEHLHPGFRATAHIHDLWVLVPATAILTLNASPHSAGTASG